MSRVPRLLILTASFGDGHNSAARGLAQAAEELAGCGARVDVLDGIRQAQPLLSRLLEKAYAAAITHTPWAWRQFYRSAGRLPLEDDPSSILQPVRDLLAQELVRDPPAAVACTFPLYPHLLNRLLGKFSLPVHTIVTDSITIHPVWRCDSVRTYFAADEISADLLKSWAAPGTEVVDSGFPVSPVLARLTRQPAGDVLRSALFFPAGSRRTFVRSLHSLLGSGPAGLRLTIVLGRHAERLGPAAREVLAAHPGREVEVLGWVNDVPRLLSTHDMVIAKAGGATTHETAAAGRPSLIVKVVPGQEEGNIELVQRRGSGVFEGDPDALGPVLARLAGGGGWTRLRDAAWRYRRPHGAQTVARHILTPILGEPSASSPATDHPAP
jgi:processive 1,2-diacylglycerol beta-glucosyltransferase